MAGRSPASLNLFRAPRFLHSSRLSIMCFDFLVQQATSSIIPSVGYINRGAIFWGDAAERHCTQAAWFSQYCGEYDRVYSLAPFCHNNCDKNQPADSDSEVHYSNESQVRSSLILWNHPNHFGYGLTCSLPPRNVSGYSRPVGYSD